MGIRSGAGALIGGLLAAWAVVHFAAKGVNSDVNNLIGNENNNNPSSAPQVETRERFRQYGRDAGDAIGGLAEGFMENVGGGQNNTNNSTGASSNDKYDLNNMCLQPGDKACEPENDGPLTRTY